MDVLHKLQLEVEALPVVDSVDIREEALLFHEESSGSNREQIYPGQSKYSLYSAIRICGYRSVGASSH